MARLPLILITPSVEKRGVEFHDLSASLSVKYENAVLQAGGIPLTVPISSDKKILAEIVRRADGVLLTGGDDINPDLYAKKPAEKNPRDHRADARRRQARFARTGFD